MQVTTDTLNFLVKVFGIVIAATLGVVVAIFAILILRDGNSPLVQDAFGNLVTLTQWLTGIIGSVLILHPVTTGIQNVLFARANLQNTQAEVTKVNALNITDSQEVPLKS